MEAGLLERREYRPGDADLVTAEGVASRPAVYALMQWGEQYRAPEGPRRTFIHVGCEAEIDACWPLPGVRGRSRTRPTWRCGLDPPR